MQNHAIIRECPVRLKSVIGALCDVAVSMADRIARGALGGTPGQVQGTNADGDVQKPLDVLADQMFMTALRHSDVRYYASEEQDKVQTFNPSGGLALAIDPLDGSSNIEVNVSIGTIFSIFEALPEAERSFLRPGRDQIAAGYFIYGPQCILCVTYGEGVRTYLLNPRNRVFEEYNRPALPSQSCEFAINVSNYRHWSKPVRAYVDDCLAGSEGPRGMDFNMRWVASLVAETHRILSRGGVFLYPADNRKGYEKGRLRHVYECAPIAMLIEQAGGLATDGSDRFLDIVPTEIHQRTPFVFGTVTKVERVRNYHDLPEEEVSALFGSRGLFRA